MSGFPFSDIPVSPDADTGPVAGAGPAGEVCARLDDLFCSLAQRRALLVYLAGLAAQLIEVPPGGRLIASGSWTCQAEL